MLAGLEGGDRSLSVQVGGIADVDEINFGIGEKVFEALVFLDFGKIHLFAGRPEVAADTPPIAGQLLGIAAANRGDLRVLELARSEVVDHAHETNADYPDSCHC